jgi:peptidoglycan/xylan/chitin deacetylase (PgdA/CDA1 family)
VQGGVRAGRALAYLSATSAIGLAARSILREPVPPLVALGATSAFAGVLLAGVFEPRLGMWADTLVRGEPCEAAPRVALTFDDGPSAKSTPALLDQLDEAGAKGTFFVIGRKLEGAGLEVARDALARGHEVACHSFAHDRFFALRGRERVREDLRRALSTLEDALGVRSKWLRPPVLHTNPIIAEIAEELCLRIVAFSVRGYDGLARADAARVESRVLGGLDDGAIVLLHDAAEREDFEPASLRALPGILAGIEERGLRAVTLSELAAPAVEAPSPAPDEA